MEPSGFVFNPDTEAYEVRSDNGSIATSFVFPPQMKGGDKLPPLHMTLWRENIVFSFNGEYNDQTDNLEFFVEGPIGFIYKGSLQVDPAQDAGDSNSGYSWKMKRHAHTREGRDQDSTQFFVPRSVCLAAATTVGSETQVVKRWTFYGRSVPQRFARLGLKLTFSPARCGENPETGQATTAHTARTIRGIGSGSPTGSPTGMPTGMPTGIPTRMPTGLPTGLQTGNLTASPTAQTATITAPQTLVLTDMESMRERGKLSKDDILFNAGLPGGELTTLQSQDTEEEDNNSPKYWCLKAANLPSQCCKAASTLPSQCCKAVSTLPNQYCKAPTLSSQYCNTPSLPSQCYNGPQQETIVARANHVMGESGDPNCLSAIPTGEMDPMDPPKRRITKNYNQRFIYKNVAI